MYVQNIIQNNQIDTADLYIRQINRLISYDTYFNSLSYSSIIKYMNSKKCYISFKYKGEADFEIRYNSKQGTKTLTKKKITSKSFKSFRTETIDLSKLVKNGYIYPVFNNISNNFIATNIKYNIESEEHKTEIIIIITTFKRHEYIIENLKKLESCKEYIKHVIVVDNAKDLNEIKSSKFITIIPNSNTGGSGGFARGMIEAKKIGCTHVFLMDDDISFCTETIERSYEFIKHLSKKHRNDWLGFSMLINNKPTIQFEMGNNWNGFKMIINNHNLNLAKKKSLLKNIIHQKYNYSAWWSIIMPISVIKNYGLPLPFFIKFDDIDYGLRRKSEEIILLNGFGVWHKNFETKLSCINEYYLMRNALINNLIHKRFSLFFNLLRYSLKYFKSLLKLDFKTTIMINEGIFDYLKGPLFLNNAIKIDYNFYLKSKLKKSKYYVFFTLPLFICNYFKLIISHNRLKQKYIECFKLLISEDNWNKIFN